MPPTPGISRSIRNRFIFDIHASVWLLAAIIGAATVIPKIKDFAWTKEKLYYRAMLVLSHLKSLQALELALRGGSLKSAAEVLSITPAAVGQRVKALEDYLGIELLARGRSGLRPTAALAIAMDHLRTAFRELEVVADTLDMQRGHEIHLAAAPDFAELWLQPRLHLFRRSHPNVRFCINGEGDAPIRIAPMDCEISFGPVRAGNGGEIILFRDFVLPISSPENTQRLLKIAKRERLEGFPLLHLDFYKNDPAAPDWSAWIGQQRLKRTAPNRGIRFQRISPILESVLASAGLTLCGMALICAFIDEGKVSLPFPIATGRWTEHAFQARFRGDALIRPQVKSFREWLIQQSGTTREWLERRVGTESPKRKRGR
jgi:LysR family glycine cleavage system transcriptional activator